MSESDYLTYTKKRLTWAFDSPGLKKTKLRVWREMILQLIHAELDLRDKVQLEEKLQFRVKASEKSMSIEPDNTIQTSDSSQALEKLQHRITLAKQTLYEKAAILPISLKNSYDLVRKDPHWFMREELVNDCASRGGCCSRTCGCCAKRESSPRQKGKGHCTVECWCCSNLRGFDLSDEQKEARNQEWKSMLRKWGSSYATTVAKSLICPISKSTGRWQSFFTRDHASQDVKNLMEGY